MPSAYGYNVIVINMDMMNPNVANCYGLPTLPKYVTGQNNGKISYLAINISFQKMLTTSVIIETLLSYKLGYFNIAQLSNGACRKLNGAPLPTNHL